MSHGTRLALFLDIFFPYFWFGVLWLIAFLLPLLSFSFLRCLLPAGFRFLTGFRLVSYRGVGVGCEAPRLRSISPNFPDGFCTLLVFYASAYMVLQGGLVPWYPRFPSIVGEALFLRR